MKKEMIGILGVLLIVATVLSSGCISEDKGDNLTDNNTTSEDVEKTMELVYKSEFSGMPVSHLQVNKIYFEEENVTCFVLIASLQKGGISCLEGKL